MKSGTILFNGTDLCLYGAPRFTMKRTPEPAAPARATHWRVEISVSVHLTAQMPATIWARAKAIQKILSDSSEGLLVIEDENGTATTWLARPGDNSLPQAIERGSGQVEMNFTATEQAATDTNPLLIVIDPLNGSAVISLNRAMSWSESVRVSRPDSRLSVREEISGTINFTARTCYADPLLNSAARAAILQAEATRIRAIASREARVQFAGFDRTVQIESFTADPSEGWEWLTVQAQARYTMLPGDTTALIKYDTDSTTDPSTGETRITLSGTVEANSEVLADNKIDALVNSFRSDNRRVLKLKKSNAYVNGDSDDDIVWIGLKFEAEFSQGSDTARYNLKIETKEGSDGKRITYSGSAYAQDFSTLMATIATAAAGMYPVEISSTITVEYTTDDTGALKIAQGSFSYEYQTAIGTVHGSVERSANNGQLGETTASVSGSISAPSFGAARTLARAQIPNGVILRTDDEKQRSVLFSSDGISTAEQGVELSFTYTWGSDHTITHISYKDSTSPDYTRMVADRTISGTAWASSKSEAEAKVANLLTALTLTLPSKSSLVHSYERRDSGTVTNRWLSFDFSYSFETAITGEIGHDIIEAEWSIERSGQVNHQPMTEVPLAYPVKQDAFGYNIGMLVATGSVKARQQTTARTWGQAKRGAVATMGATTGAEDPPRERMGVTLLPFNGTTSAFFSFSFTYSFRYATDLGGLWPSSGLTL